METKIKKCSCCKIEKPATTEYFYRRGHEGQVRHVCIKCCVEKNQQKSLLKQQEKERLFNEQLLSPTKTCFKCKVEKPKTEFGIVKKNKDGLNGKCRICHNQESVEWSKNNPESRNASRAKWAENNPDYPSQWYERNRPSVLQRLVFYRIEKGDELREKNREKAKSPERKARRNKKTKERYKTDPDFKFQCNIMAWIRGIDNRDDFKQEWGDVMDVYVMYGVKYNIDHKVPRSWFKHTAPVELVNDIRNLQVVDWKYNNSKVNRWADPVSNEYLGLIEPHIKQEYYERLFG